MRLTTQSHLLREAVKEILREGSERVMGMSASAAQDLRDYERKMAEFRAASIPSGIGTDGFIGKSVYLRYVTDKDREALIVSRNSPTDATATEYLIYLFDYSNIDVNKAGMLSPPTMKNVSDSEIQTILESGDWKTSDRAVDYMFKQSEDQGNKLDPERFKLVSVSDPSMKPWRLFGPIVDHNATDVVMTGGGMILDTMGALAELSPTLAARLSNPRAILALGAVKALDKFWTLGGMAASARNVVDSWNGYTDVSSTKMMDPENKRKKIKAQSAAVSLDVIGFLLSGLALYIDSTSEDGSPASATAELFPVVLKWGTYAANMGMNAEETLDYVRDIWNDAKDVLDSALKSAIRTATDETLQALQFFDKMIHT